MHSQKIESNYTARLLHLVVLKSFTFSRSFVLQRVYTLFVKNQAQLSACWQRIFQDFLQFKKSPDNRWKKKSSGFTNLGRLSS